jgi:ubiquinone/menaquinone biosynthesis C-methylase UbiE
MITDPLFYELSRYVWGTSRFIDIGCGYGVPALWLLNSCPESRVTVFEPRSDRVRVAERVFSGRGEVHEAKAPDLPEVNTKADTVLMIDMIHNLSDGDLQKTLKWVKKHLRRNGALVIRATVPAGKSIHWMRLIETLRLRIERLSPLYRSGDEIENILEKSGFTVLKREASGKKREEVWFIAGK